jgi:hypothetical protein
VKYKVSLLPESRKKQINARNLIKKITAVSCMVLAVLVAFLAVVFGVNLYANNQLEEAKKLDSECIAEIDKLSSYRDIHAALQERVNLFDKIQVKDPQIYDFILKWSKIDHPGVSVESIQCTDWKTTRLCTITGSCDSRSQYLAYEKALSKIDGVSSVSCVSYTSNVGGDEADQATFTISVSVGGGVVVTEATTAVATTAAAQ